MSDFDYNVLTGIIDQKKWEIKRLEKESMFMGFMKSDIPMLPTNPRLEKIQNSLSVREYNLLRTTCYTSTKEEVNQYIEVLKKMVDAGIFDTAPCMTPFQPFQSNTSSVNWGGVNQPWGMAPDTNETDGENVPE